ncbi:MAG TPA: S53 family peptidase [Acidimicrobiales bacterium]|jgi:kumamolisin
MTFPDRVAVAGSERDLPAAHVRVGDVDPEERATVTVYVRPRARIEDPVAGAGGEPALTREEYAERYGAAPEDIDVIRAFAAGHGLSVDEVDAGRRAVTLSGRLGDLQAAFGASLGIHADSAGRQYRGRTGTLWLVPSVAEVVTGVFGLDARPQAGPGFRIAATPAVQYTPVQVASAYSFPAGVDGTGECVALIELGGGFRTADLDTYFSGLGLATPAVVAVGVDGGTNTPGTSTGPDGEVMLDIEVVGAVAPGATIAVYFAPNTDQGFLDAVSTAVHDTVHRPSVVSISWGGPESTWTAQAMNEMEAAFTTAATLGVTVVAAAGDNGSTDGVTDGLQHADFPASAPHALACGGTTLNATTEVVWNSLASGGGGTGGGISDQFALPSYQAAAGVPPSANPGGRVGRGLPDVAADADPNTGYAVRVDGQNLVIGGTSAVAPLWSALVARFNHALGTPVGFVHARLYAAAAALHDITQGNNGAYQARAGWDACTGLGSPNGAVLLAALSPAGGGATPAGGGAMLTGGGPAGSGASAGGPAEGQA